jgi:hypothetical protein
MSSTYNVICLSHAPAIEEGADFTGADEALGALIRGRHISVARHRYCDIVIGRWSGALVEVCCPGRAIPLTEGDYRHHRDPEWLRVGWLRLLHHARQNDDGTDGLLGHDGYCWPEDRLNRLEPLFRREAP